jgi:hypothetical protein
MGKELPLTLKVYAQSLDSCCPFPRPGLLSSKNYTAASALLFPSMFVHRLWSNTRAEQLQRLYIMWENRGSMCVSLTGSLCDLRQVRCPLWASAVVSIKWHQ